ncbi:MAG: nitroreductase family protein [Clostridia bacterium]|nr:nitroreductase family protein [Clostridia bacterium]
MNPVIENIMTRRSIRSFTDKKIPRRDLETIVKAGIYAPSAMNRQLWHFTVITSESAISALAAAIAKELGRDSGYNFYKPTAMIAVSCSDGTDYYREDCACALENIFLAAHSLGIGSVWINQLNGICDRPDIRKQLDALGIPSGNRVWGMAALGYAAPDQLERKPKNPDVVNWVE